MIDAFLHGLESIFAWLVEASWQASVLAALVLLLQRALRGRLNPRWHHALWLLVVARLLLPFLPESALSLFQFAPPPPPLVEQTITEPIFSSAPLMPEATVPTAPTPLPQYPLSAFTILALVWLAGALGLLLLTWFVNRCYARHVLTAPAITAPRLLQLAEAAMQEIGIRRSLRMIESGQVQSPAIIGLFHPTLILPKDVCSRFDDDELRFIFLHEFAHLKRGDLVLQWLVALLQILHWFNPVLWYAFRRMRIDREPATDALVLSRTGEACKESYGQVLVKLLQHYHQRHSLPTLVGILEDKDQFKRRFTLITKFTRGAYGWSLLGFAMLALLAAICLTKAKAQDAAPKAQKYFELILVEEKPGTNDGLGASGPVWAEDFAKLLKNPNCKITVLADAPVQDGPISLRAQTPAGFDVTVTGNWNTSISTPQKIGYHFHQQPHPTAIGTMLEQSWESSDVLSERNPVILLLAGSVDDHDHVLIRIVDRPAAVTSATNASGQSSASSVKAEKGITFDTLAQLVQALTDKAKTIPHDHQRLQILQGFYGADGSWRDVTGILQKLVKNDTLKVSWQQPYTEIGGDPDWGQVKTLIISYRLDGIDKLATFREENPPVGLQATLPTQSEGSSADPSLPLDKASSASTIASGKDQKEIAAVVNGHVITTSQLRDTWQSSENILRANYSGDELKAKLLEYRKNCLNALIDRQLILDDFKAQGRFIQSSYTDERIDDIVRGQYGGDRQAFLAALAQHGQTLDAYRKQMENNAIVGYMRNKFVEEKVQDYYEAHLDLFPAEEQLRITPVEIKGSVPVPFGHTADFAKETDPRAATARDVLCKMRAGEDVSSLASTDGIDLSLAGKTRWVTREHYPSWWPITWAQVESLNPGETTEVAVSDGSSSSPGHPEQNYHFYFIIRLDDRHPAKIPATADALNQEKALLDAERRRAQEDWFVPLRAKAKIQIFEANLALDSLATDPPAAAPLKTHVLTY